MSKLKTRLQHWRRDSNRWTWILLLLVLFIGVPIYTIAYSLFLGAGDMWEHILNNLLFKYLSNSLVLAIGCSILSIFFGVFSAWAVTHYRFPLRKLLDTLLVLPLAIPSYITAYTYTGLFDNGGSFQVFFRQFGITFPKIDFMNIYGLIWVLSLSLFPYIYLSSKLAFSQQSKRLLEASRLLGTSYFSYFRKIALPLARPAIVAGMALVLMEVLNDYGAAKYYGVRTFTTGIFRSWFSLEDIQTAIYLSAILLGFIFLLLFLEKWQRRNKQYTNSRNQQALAITIPLKKWQQIIVMSIVSIPVLFGFVLPLIQLLYWAFLTYDKVLNSEFISLILQSFGIAAGAALVTTFMAFIFLFIGQWSRMQGIKWLAKSATLGYAIPGAIIAIGVLIPTLALDKWLVDFFYTNFEYKMGFIINGTVIALFYAYMVRFLTVAYNPLEAGALKIGHQLSESAQLLGKNNLQTLLKIQLPLLKTSLLTAFIFVFIDVLKELPLTLILKPYDVQTLAVKSYEYASDEMIAEAALPSLAIILTGLFFVLLLNKRNAQS